jgi:hypothetical protein
MQHEAPRSFFSEDARGIGGLRFGGLCPGLSVARKSKRRQAVRWWTIAWARQMDKQTFACFPQAAFPKLHARPVCAPNHIPFNAPPLPTLLRSCCFRNRHFHAPRVFPPPLNSSFHITPVFRQIVRPSTHFSSAPIEHSRHPTPNHDHIAHHDTGPDSSASLTVRLGQRRLCGTQ